MRAVFEAEAHTSSAPAYDRALLALKGLPDHCVRDVGELATRIGADKLDLIYWVRADIEFARLIASKVAQ